MIAFMIFLVVNVLMACVQGFVLFVGTMGLANEPNVTVWTILIFGLILFGIGTLPNVILYFVLGKVFHLSGVALSFWIFEGLVIAFYFVGIFIFG